MFAHRLQEIQQRIAEAATRSGRGLHQVRLIAVSKTHGPERIAEAYAAGLRDFGESRVQEAEDKFIPQFRARGGDGTQLHAQAAAGYADLRLHLIGRLQTNKVKKVPGLFDCVHSVDREQLLLELDKRLSSPLDLLIQVNTSGEEQKQGVRSIDGAAALLHSSLSCRYVRVVGFMSMAPYTTDTGTIRRCFAATRKLAELCRERFPELPLPELSMGMSNDYELAVEEGATMVRVGSALFGEE